MELHPAAAADNGRPALFVHAFDMMQANPGRVVVRRLNRTEYNNTIRDLCMIEYKPAESFPSDELHDGFDNNGVSLSISPRRKAS